LKTKDRKVKKYIHHDRSETAIKNVSGCGDNSKDKYSIFLSCSYGCRANCKFCMLNTKGIGYKRLNTIDVINNAIDALTDYSLVSDIDEKALKISWMGMGEPSLHLNLIYHASNVIAEWALRGQCPVASSLDRIDISTSLPLGFLDPRIIKLVETLAGDCESFLLRDPDVPSVKLFLSILSVIPDTRAFLFGNNGKFVNNSTFENKNINQDATIIHHLLLDEINDTDKEVDFFLKFLNKYFPAVELRLLRYNQCPGSGFTESKRFNEIAARFKQELPRVKIQESPGSEIMAACGQFLLGDFK
jgi:adenine C2-methylase RlmN of 23S rRNA A2503 and tRNA A37